MRERLDCAVLVTRCTEKWLGPMIGQHAGGRLHMHVYDQVIDLASDSAHLSLLQAAMGLRRFDVCLLPASPSTLSWARIALSQEGLQLHTPVLALAKDLTAAGLCDLHELGVSDFLRSPFCSHEARVRIERLLDGIRLGTAGASYRRQLAVQGASHRTSVEDVAAPALTGHGFSSEIPELEAFAVAAASRSANSRESFKSAKSKVIERFERAYISAALGRHGGNIAMAARAAQKHRRAFWALMRKHDIDAEPFRSDAAAEQEKSGTVIAPDFGQASGQDGLKGGHAPYSHRASGARYHRHDGKGMLVPSPPATKVEVGGEGSGRWGHFILRGG